MAKEVATHLSLVARTYQKYTASGHNGIYVNPIQSGEERPSEAVAFECRSTRLTASWLKLNLRDTAIHKLDIGALS